MEEHHRHRVRAHAHRRHIKRDPSLVTKTVFYDPASTTIGNILSTAAMATDGAAASPETTTNVGGGTTTFRKTTKSNSASSFVKPKSEGNDGISSTSTTASLTRGLELSTSIAAVASPIATSSSTYIGTIESAVSTTSLLASASGNAEASSGISAGATAGLAGAGAAIAILALVAGFFIYRRKAQQKRQEAYGSIADEKNTPSGAALGFHGSHGSNASHPGGMPIPIVAVTEFNEKSTPSLSSELPPQVSLRPVTEFMPNLGGAPATTGAASAGALGAVAARAAGGAAAQKQEPQQTQQTQQRQPQKTQMARSLSRKEPPPALVLQKPNDITPAKETVGARPLLPLGVQPASPTPSSFTDASVTVSPFAGGPAAAAAGGPAAAAAAAPVHRVQMDFVPSMGDELELRSGQLVRIVHEYDDGWALCVRLDRSQQGVCPRTCLSQRPVKPRQGPAPGAPGAHGPAPHHSGLPMATPERPQSGSGSPSATGPHNDAPVSAVIGGQPARPESPVSHPQTPTILQSTAMRPQSASVHQSPASRPQSPAILIPPMRPQSPAIRPQSPGGGYYKPQYRPASSVSQLQSSVVPGTPTTPNITVTTSHDRPASPSSTTSPTSPSQGPQIPTVSPRPAAAPIRPSPLSNQTSSSDDEKREDEQPQPEQPQPEQPLQQQQEPVESDEPQPEKSQPEQPASSSPPPAFHAM